MAMHHIIHGKKNILVNKIYLKRKRFFSSLYNQNTHVLYTKSGNIRGGKSTKTFVKNSKKEKAGKQNKIN